MSPRHEFTSLGDLLRDDNPGRTGRRRWVGAVIRSVLIAAVLAGLIYGLTVVLVGVGVPFPFVFAVLFALLIGRELVASMQPLPPPAVPIREIDEAVAYELPDRPFAEVRRWENRLDWIVGDPERFTRVVLPAISEAVDERLRFAHSVSREHDPERAKEILGPRVWHFLHPEETNRAPSPREMVNIIRELEKL